MFLPCDWRVHSFKWSHFCKTKWIQGSHGPPMPVFKWVTTKKCFKWTLNPQKFIYKYFSTPCNNSNSIFKGQFCVTGKTNICFVCFVKYISFGIPYFLQFWLLLNICVKNKFIFYFGSFYNVQQWYNQALAVEHILIILVLLFWNKTIEI